MMLTELLEDLLKQAAKICEEWKRNGRICKEPCLYIKQRIEKFEYNEGNINYSSVSSPIEKEEWRLRDILNLIDTIKEEVPAYKEVSKILAETYNTTQPQADFWLDKFLQLSLTRYLEGKNPTDMIVTFIGDLNDSPRKWKIEVWLEGVWMDVEKINIEKGVIIRKTQKSDLEIEYEYPFVPPFRGGFVRAPSAILEINKRVKFMPFVYPDLEKLILILQLYKVGSVNKIQVKWDPKSILHSGAISYTHDIRTITYKYPLSENDAKPISKFIERISPLLPTDEHGRALSSNPIGIAILRYQDSLLKPEAIENKIAYSIMGLETLYLKAAEREELSHRLAQRVAKVLGFFNETPIKTYKIIKEAYEVRSNFVHGSPQVGEPSKMKEVLDKTIDYLRRSILVFLQIGKKKDDFITLIDKAMLDSQAAEELRKIVQEDILT